MLGEFTADLFLQPPAVGLIENSLDFGCQVAKREGLRQHTGYVQLLSLTNYAVVQFRTHQYARQRVGGRTDLLKRLGDW